MIRQLKKTYSIIKTTGFNKTICDFEQQELADVRCSLSHHKWNLDSNQPNMYCNP